MRSLINLTLIIVTIVLTLLVAGCQQQSAPVPVAPSPTPAPTQTPSPIEEPTRETAPSSAPIFEEGWALHSDPGEGYEIALPSTWKVVTEEKTQPGGGAKYLFYAVDPVCSTPVLGVDGSFSIVMASLEQQVSLAVLEDKLTCPPKTSPVSC